MSKNKNRSFSDSRDMAKSGKNAGGSNMNKASSQQNQGNGKRKANQENNPDSYNSNKAPVNRKPDRETSNRNLDRGSSNRAPSTDRGPGSSAPDRGSSNRAPGTSRGPGSSAPDRGSSNRAPGTGRGPNSRYAAGSQNTPPYDGKGSRNRSGGMRKSGVQLKKVRKIKPTSRSANAVSDADVQHMPDSYRSSERYAYLKKNSIFPLSKKAKSAIIVVILILLVTGLAIWSMSMKTTEPLSNYDVLLSDDHSCKIKVPYTWQSADMANENGLLAAKSKESHSYLYVSMDSRYDKDVDADTYIASYISDMRKNSDSISDFKLIKQPSEKQIGPNTGYYFELSASTDGISLHTYDFLVLTDDGYLHADITTDGDDVDIERQAEAILESLRYDRTGQLTDGKY